MVQVGLCSYPLLITLDKPVISLSFQKTTDMYIAIFYVNNEEFTLLHGLLDCFSYWSSSEEAIIFIFNSKAGNSLGTWSTFGLNHKLTNCLLHL